MIRTVSRKDFWPSPKVDSAVLRLDIKNNVYKVDEGLFFQLVRMGFSSRRKMLKNNLAQGLNIPPSQVSTMLMDIGVTPGVRAQELQLQDWMNILGKMGKYMI